MDPKSTVTRWVSTRLDELIEEEMGSGTEVERNDFKASVETFLGRMKVVKEEVNESVKSARQKSAEIYGAARVESALVFDIDDEPIPGVDTPASPSIGSSSRGASIVLSGAESRKKKALSKH